MTLTAQQVLDAILSNKSSEKDVGYYNKEITKKKQRNNKDIEKMESVLTPSSSDLASLSATPAAPPLEDEVTLAATPSGREGQEREAGPHNPESVNQAPTSSAPPKHITSKVIKRAVVQYYHNEGSARLHERKIKVRLNCLFGDKEKNVEFIATMTNDLGNFKKYHPEESREFIQALAMQARSDLKSTLNVKPYMGKFHMNHGWRKDASQVNQIEPWTCALLWYNHQIKRYQVLVRIYDWEEIFELGDDTITEKQKKTNLRAQKLWYNPEHLNLIRPQTWAQSMGLE